MKFFLVFALLGSLGANAHAIPKTDRDPSLSGDGFGPGDVTYIDVERRKGGGGGGKGGSGGKVGPSSEGSSSSSRTSPSSNRGGTSGSSTASGVRPAYGSGGQYYGGGAKAPYTAGLRSPNGLLAGGLLTGDALSDFHGPWYHPAYYYPYPEPYTFHNASAGANQTKPVICLCEQYQECGCDNNTDPTYMNSLLGNGSTSALNQTLVQVNDVNGTSTILINGTLPNGTVAAGGSSAASGRVGGEPMGIPSWVVVGVIMSVVLF